MASSVEKIEIEFEVWFGSGGAGKEAGAASTAGAKKERNLDQKLRLSPINRLLLLLLLLLLLVLLLLLLLLVYY